MYRLKLMEESHWNIETIDMVTDIFVIDCDPDEAVYIWIGWWVTNNELVVPMRMSCFCANDGEA